MAGETSSEGLVELDIFDAKWKIIFMLQSMIRTIK